MYRIFIERRAEHDLNALERGIRERVIKYILKLRINPRSGGKKLIDAKNSWRVRINDWRVIYEIDDKNKIIKIYRVKHRSKAY